MRKGTFWTAWVLGNLAWFFGAPILLGLLLGADAQGGTAGAASTASGRDSPQILVAGFAIVNGALLVLVNAIWGVVALVRRRRRKSAA